MKILCAYLNSKLLRFHGIQNFANSDTENAELASKMLRQQHFLYQRKNLYTRNLYEVFQVRQQQRIFMKSIHPLSPFFSPIHPRTLYRIVWHPTVLYEGTEKLLYFRDKKILSARSDNIKNIEYQLRQYRTPKQETSAGIYGNT